MHQASQALTVATSEQHPAPVLRTKNISRNALVKSRKSGRLTRPSWTVTLMACTMPLARPPQVTMARLDPPGAGLPASMPASSTTIGEYSGSGQAQSSTGTTFSNLVSRMSNQNVHFRKVSPRLLNISSCHSPICHRAVVQHKVSRRCRIWIHRSKLGSLSHLQSQCESLRKVGILRYRHHPHTPFPRPRRPRLPRPPWIHLPSLRNVIHLAMGHFRGNTDPCLSVLRTRGERLWEEGSLSPVVSLIVDNAF
jgi:hypothetical protein